MRTIYKYNAKSGQVEPVYQVNDAGERLYIIGDNLGQKYWNPAYKKSDPNGWTDSKSKFRELTQRAGCIEVGNESMEMKERSARPYDVKSAFLRAKRFLTYKNDW